ncbi:MFS general substrate transporter [Aaosphaeria arxii CBS 175.79]|uniref:MFS general substrate transporter n=1 Tax=Aaosphaeria arxii CBS 175.79 TaxID=1450172 RepID=A0A6A5Y1Y6_9PLEO|nr:MFS general substrate transporter [Aaosphaeria arxii CBS 175.79]KAF2019077.1 MFS general substrate transporter [Aaosphaeria arxii CBS 175.79]
MMNLENGLVGWESSNDPQNPLNWRPARKWTTTCLLSVIGFTTPFASSILAPAISHVDAEFQIHDLTKSSMPVSIFLLGYAVGPLLLSPLSELYGRHIVMTAANASFCLWLIGCALAPSLNSLIAFRLLCGIGGSASQTVGGAIIGDLFTVQKRGRAMAIWTIGPIFGPSLAPVIGGFVVQYLDWRWVNWLTLCLAVPATVLLALCSRETNPRIILQRKVAKLRVELARPELRSVFAGSEAVLSPKKVLMNGLMKPLQLLFGSSVVFGVSLYIAFAYGCLYLLFNTIPIVFQTTYGWSLGVSGVAYLALLLGYLIGLVIFYCLSDKLVKRLMHANNGAFEAEFRLPVAVYSAALLPVSFFLYGWTSQNKVFCAVPIIALVIFGTGFECIWLPTQSYIIDAYPQHVASALAAACVMRSIVAAFLPLAGPGMYQALGLGWGNSVLGFIALGLTPVPILLRRYGKLLREKAD